MNTVLSIGNDTDLLKKIYELIENNSLNIEKTVISEEMKKISICFKGSLYKSSISTNVMKAFLQLQDAIYSIYSIHTYGEKRRLNIEIKKALELNVIVEEGSSKYLLNLEKVFEAMGDRIKAATEKELKVIAGIIGVVFLTATLGSKAIDHKTEIEKMQIFSSTLTGIQKNTADAVLEVLNTQQSFYRTLSGQNFDSLEINNQLFTQEELSGMVKVERIKHPIETKIYTGKYKITDIHFGEDVNKLDVHCPDGLVIKNVNILEGIISADNYQWFKDSASGKEVDMTIVATIKNNEIIASYLHDFSTPKKED